MVKYILTKIVHAPEYSKTLKVFDNFDEAENYVQKQYDNFREEIANPSAKPFFHFHRRFINRRTLFFSDCVYKFYYIFNKLDDEDEARLIREYEISICRDNSELI